MGLVQPLVGISCYMTEASWGPRTGVAALLPESYVRAVHRTGGVALLLPEAPPVGVEAVAARLDALVLAGGEDVDPARYDADLNTATTVASPERDEWELALLESALRRDLPTLAICRGAQVLNVACGGGLVQHLPDVLGHDRHLPDALRTGPQRLTLDPDSTLGRVLGETADVRCHHHQGLAALGADLRAVAWAGDGIVEGVEHGEAHFVIGAQWHPEQSADGRLFAALTDAARPA